MEEGMVSILLDSAMGLGVVSVLLESSSSIVWTCTSTAACNSRGFCQDEASETTLLRKHHPLIVSGME